MQFLKSKNKSALAITGLTLLVVASALWLDDKASQPGSAPAITPEQSSLPDYFMEDYNITSTDITGKPFRWLSGNKLEHLPNGDTNLIQPKLQFSQKEQHWLLLAETGTISEGSGENSREISRENNTESNNEIENHLLSNQENHSVQKQPDKKITLDGNVRIQQLNGRTKALSIQTKHLDISITDNSASTDSKVTVSDENGEISAIGMNINFDQHQLRLLSQVKGHYVFE